MFYYETICVAEKKLITLINKLKTIIKNVSFLDAQSNSVRVNCRARIFPKGFSSCKKIFATWMKGDARVRSYVFVHSSERRMADPIIAIYTSKSLASGEDVPRTTAERYLGSGFKMTAV